MKTKLILTCVVAIILLSSGACSSVPEQVSVDASYTGKEVEIAVHGSLIVTLDSNPSTGFQWSQQAQISDQTVLGQTDHEFMPAESAAIGAAGKEVWTFKALKKGKSTISMEYRQPWEQSGPAAKTFTLTVAVK